MEFPLPPSDDFQDVPSGPFEHPDYSDEADERAGLEAAALLDGAILAGTTEREIELTIRTLPETPQVAAWVNRFLQRDLRPLDSYYDTDEANEA